MKLAITILLAAGAAAQTRPEDNRPSLFFREDWKETPAATPVTAGHLTNPKLQLALYGPGKDGLKKSHHDAPKDDPYYNWTGTCDGNCALTLRDKGAFVDLSGLAKIRWRTKQSGFRSLHLLLKLANGMWLVIEQADGSSSDWKESEFAIQDARWRQLDIRAVVEGAWVEHPDLSRVDEIGWTDLMTGGGTPASSRVDWIEVYGRHVTRQ